VLFKNAVKRLAPGDFAGHGPMDDRTSVDQAPVLALSWPEGVRRPRVGLVRDIDVYPYWTKYERFLTANRIEVGAYDIHRSSWIEDAAAFDMILWRPLSFPFELEECRRKFYVLERHLGKLCYPSYDEALLYEDKILQYEMLKLRGLPVIDTFISHSADETLGHMQQRSYPAVWKASTGSGSLGVELLRRARPGQRWARKVFSFAGRRTCWPYLAQKNYVYVQRLVPNQGFDVRVIVIGDKVLGYYRDVPRGEFRASGMGTVRKDRLPPKAVIIARRAAEALRAPCLGVDMLIDTSGERAFIIEVSSFFQVITPEQLHVDGVPGMLVGDDLEFVPIRVWPQELALQHVLERQWVPYAQSEKGLGPEALPGQV
jgi:glutathione synthase/RimK-type ligase-like ATP-grasp enzyme